MSPSCMVNVTFLARMVLIRSCLIEVVMHGRLQGAIFRSWSLSPRFKVPDLHLDNLFFFNVLMFMTIADMLLIRRQSINQ